MEFISIHALREEGDGQRRRRQGHGSDFYPRPPRGGRPQQFYLLVQKCPISIHALREEGDRVLLLQGGKHSNFYPRPPRGGRPAVPLG